MYKMEQSSLLKYSHLLSHKAVYPSPIEKQNVKFVLNVFNEKTISALKCLSTDHSDEFFDVEGTLKLMEIVCQWWKIVNVQSALEEKRFNDKWRACIRKDNDFQKNFLKNLSLWLKNWRLSIPDKESLTSQTFSALINTTDAYLKLIDYLFDNVQLEYILLGKFQSDDLEARFGMYRQQAGANYYIGLVQLLESERRLRFKTMILLAAAAESISLKTLLPVNDPVIDICITQFMTVVNDNFTFDLIPKEIFPILTYISGYSVMKELRKSCSICKSWLQLEKDVDIDLESTNQYDFIKDLDRGKLTLPTETALMATCIAWEIMEKLIQNHKVQFFKSPGQLSIMFKLCCIQLERQCVESDMCACGRTLRVELQAVMLRVCRILLNNLTKQINDVGNAANSQRKLRKLN